jgi:diacylglycerol kinase family enzyme
VVGLTLTGLFLNPLHVPLPAFFDVHQRKAFRRQTEKYDPPSHKGKHFVVLVNPNAGAGQGLLIYEEIVKPMLEKAKVSHDIIFTVGSGHAQKSCAMIAAGKVRVESGTGKLLDKTVRTITIKKKIDCVISCSGDGMLHECLNGLLQATGSCGVPLAVVPVGSGNGVSDSLYGRKCGPHKALEKIINGEAAPIDVMAMSYEGSDDVTYDLHFFSWAVFADHDYLTESSLRFLGPVVKMILAPIIVIFRMTHYQGVVDFVPVQPPKDLLKSGSYVDPKIFPASPTKGMRRIEDGFWCFGAGNLAEAGGDLAATPNIANDEGAVDILLVTKSKGNVNSFKGLGIFLAAETGEHVKRDDVMVLKTNKFHLTPGKSKYRGSRGHIQLSGQEMPLPREGERVTVEVFRGRVTVMM